MPLNDAQLTALARYLDGDLTGAALEEFERHLNGSPELRAELESQSQIARSLQRSFKPSIVSGANILALASRSTDAVSHAAAGESVPRSSATLFRRLGLAAVFALGVFGCWMIWQQFKPDPPAPIVTITKPRTAAEYYGFKVNQGFEPDWVCANDQEFSQTFRDRFGQPMSLKPAQDGVHMLGLSYTNIFSPHTIAMLGKANDQSAVVLIDRLTSDNTELALVGCGNLKVHRREFGSLVAYEISPMPEPHLLDLLALPEASGGEPGG